MFYYAAESEILQVGDLIAVQILKKNLRSI